VYVRCLEGQDKGAIDSFRDQSTLEITQRIALDLGALQALAVSCAQGEASEAPTGFTCVLSGEGLNDGIIPYLLSRDMVGVAMTRSGGKVHLVPPCAFSCAHLAGMAPAVLEELQRGAGGLVNPQCYLLALVTDARTMPLDGLEFQKSRKRTDVDPATTVTAVPPPELVARGLRSPRCTHVSLSCCN
jgi:hypothetical protein